MTLCEVRLLDKVRTRDFSAGKCLHKIKSYKLSEQGSCRLTVCQSIPEKQFIRSYNEHIEFASKVSSMHLVNTPQRYR